MNKKLLVSFALASLTQYHLIYGGRHGLARYILTFLDTENTL